MTDTAIYSDSAERAVLAVLLMDGSMAPTIDLDAREFFIRRYGMIYNTIQALTKKGKPVDILTVTELLKARGKLDEVGGFAGVSELMLDNVTYTALPEYAAIIRDKANRRKALELAQQLAAAAMNEAEPYSAGEYANRILQTEAQATDTVHISQALSSFLDWQMGRVEMRERGELGLLPTTKLPELDALLVYLEPGQETIIAGEPGVGKTMLAQQIIESNQSTKSIIFSLEMRATRLTSRLVSGRSGVPVSAMRMGLPGEYAEKQQRAIYTAVAELETAGIYINDRPGITVEGMYAETARLIAQGHKLGLCAIDYFGLIADNGGYSNQVEREEVVSMKLQRMFRQLDIHGLVIDTYNKAGFNQGTGRMGNITGAARKSYDADNVITLTLGDTAQTGQLVHADVVKVRDGEVSRKRVSLMREIGKPRYRSLTENEQNNMPGVE